MHGAIADIVEAAAPIYYFSRKLRVSGKSIYNRGIRGLAYNI